ncbi:MAG: sensor histidine kinase [Gammaproteobacteria bacterium]
MASVKVEARREPAAGWAALKRLPSAAWVTLLAMLVGIFLIAAMGDGSTQLIVISVIAVVLLLVVARLYAAEVIRQESVRLAADQQALDLEKLVELRTRELSELSTHLQVFAEKEKSELARNLHDELGGLLTAAKMDLSWLQSRLAEPNYNGRLAQLGTVLDEAMDLKRRVVEDLRPSLLDHFGLPTALRAHVESVCQKAELQCEVTMCEDAETIPKELAIGLFRVIQEGLTNVVRHSHAKQVRLALSSDAKRYLLLLMDDGVGIKLNDTRFRWSHGLAGMRHRVQALGGQFAIESSPAEGTTLRVEMPKLSEQGVRASMLS